MRRHKYLFSITNDKPSKLNIDIELLETTVGYQYYNYKKVYYAGDVFQVTENGKVFYAMIYNNNYRWRNNSSNLMVILNQEGLQQLIIMATENKL